MKPNVLKVHPKDNVLVALRDLAKGETVSYEGDEYTTREKIPAKHKLFIKDMNAGDKVIMYGVLVGKTQSAVPAGGVIKTQKKKKTAGPF